MKKLPRKRTIATIILISGIVVLSLIALRFIRHRLAYATTDAVFIRTDSLVNLGFDKVGGRITSMNKNEGEEVQAGETLATIDDRQYRLAVTGLEAELQEARDELSKRKLSRDRLAQETELNEDIARDEVTRLQAELAALKAKAASVATVISQLERDQKRYTELAAINAVATKKVEDVDTELSQHREELAAFDKQAQALAAAAAAAQKKVELAISNRLLVKETEKSISSQTQKVAALTASLEQAQDRLAKCALTSTLTGRVARRFSSPGDVVANGQAVFALVDPSDVFAVALLEENKLKGVNAGATADLTLDAYPDKHFRGTVKEVMPASAATFALVPRDISAGEFTKVAQRIPVRITITDGDLSLLRVGLGGEVEIKRQ
ncbi:MAG: HlyD family secretion protein [Desulfobulbales bacterium]